MAALFITFGRRTIYFDSKSICFLFLDSIYGLVILSLFIKYLCFLSYCCFVLCIDIILCSMVVKENFEQVVQIVVLYDIRGAIIKICKCTTTQVDHMRPSNIYNYLNLCYLSSLAYIFYILVSHRATLLFFSNLMLLYLFIAISSTNNSLYHLIIQLLSLYFSKLLWCCL